MSSSQPKANWLAEMEYLTRYAGSGVINTVFGFIVIFSAMALDFSPMISNVAGYVVGFLLGFVLSKKFVFRSNGHFVKESGHYLIVFAISFVVNLLVLQFTTAYLNFHVVVSQVAAAGSYTFTMYILSRKFVFNIKSTNIQNQKK